MDRLFIVVPCFNEEEMLPVTIDRLSSLVEKMMLKERIAVNSRVLFVDDGSKDKTFELIAAAYKTNPLVCGLKLARNSGHQNALVAGVEAAVDAGADMIITIDADLQDDIDVIPEMVEKFTAGADIVYGVRKERNTDSFFKKYTAQLFYKLMKRMGVNLVYNHADFRLMSSLSAKSL